MDKFPNSMDRPGESWMRKDSFYKGSFKFLFSEIEFQVIVAFLETFATAESLQGMSGKH